MAGQPADRVGDDGGASELAARVGARLRERRTRLGATLAQVAGEAEISVSHLSAIEKGSTSPSLPVLARIVHALRLTLNEILEGEGDIPVHPARVDAAVGGELSLSHPALGLEVRALVADPGDAGECPVELDGAQLFVFVDQGALEVEVDGDEHALARGDALDAVAVGRMRWRVLGEERCVSIWAGGKLPTAAR